MTLPQAHLVYAGNSLVQANGHLVYARFVDMLMSPDSNPLGRKIGESSISMADAVENMKVAAWDYSDPTAAIALSGWESGPDKWTAQYSCFRLDMGIYSGEVVKTFTTNLSSVKMGVTADPTWRVGYRFSNSPIPEDDWTWADEAPSVTGIGSAFARLPIGVTSQDYLFIIITHSPYIDTSPEIGSTNSEIYPLTDFMRIYF